ncbi:hypothetical protein G1H11_18125 [Phytoactinopolyspora alkaliphila]|uniref:Uncharacterized protein n=1 Tax=Phytoactinopolyspora alkaliphila TaxID=1783498 RepID=A0A6N9YQY0_9ACTN|nr:hypothetical protein [Phytoactinopolyspora alkaliphila]NED97219.1 hypothetical protein [Phytoactinopolyspora alkaliphila]
MLEALSESSTDPTRVIEALTLFAWDSVTNSADLTCTLEEIDALWDLLENDGGSVISRADARHIVTEGWVDAVAAERGSPGIDALSGLHTTGYLIGRIHELDRLTDGATAALILLAVTWKQPDSPWTRISHILQVASALRDAVRPEATLGQFGTHCSLALVPDDTRSRLERVLLNKRLQTEELRTSGIAVNLFPLPEDRSRVTELIVRLQDGSTVGDKSGPIGRYHPGHESLD